MLHDVLQEPAGSQEVRERGPVLVTGQPRLAALYRWSAAELSIPELTTLVHNGVPTYSWDVADVEPWNPATGRLATAARSFLPVPGHRR